MGEFTIESLPYLDSPVNEEEIVAAKRLIEKEFDRIYTDEAHPAVAKPKKSFLTPALEAEVRRIEDGAEREGGIDLSRYNDVYVDGTNGRRLNMERAYPLLYYTKSRLDNLDLLAVQGKNEWLMGNDQLENSLKALEELYTARKREVEQVNESRKAAQMNSKPMHDYLNERWKTGIQNVIDVKLECLRLEQEIAQLRQSS
ncbi:hypothetical protein TRVA0_037S00122 [Trichomonascus vanleenenianus]|uniref:uncharacterized protein n=1 Tax=Trichomonascus vanleenenianus TaxID=2268995 RepID=UPI003ECA1F05